MLTPARPNSMLVEEARSAWMSTDPPDGLLACIRFERWMAAVAGHAAQMPPILRVNEYRCIEPHPLPQWDDTHLTT